jgi:hypothetical protein
MLTMTSLMSLPQNCHEPVIRMHPQGHVIPMLTTNMALMISEHAEATTRRQTVVGLQMQMRGHQPLMGRLAHGEPRLGDGLGDCAEDDDFDSMALLHAGGRTHSTRLNLLLNMYGIGMVMVVYAHWGGDLLESAKLQHYDKKGGSQLERFELSAQLFNIFIVLAGVADKEHGVSMAQLRQELCTNAAALYATHYSNLPEIINAIYHATSQWHGGCTRCSIVGRLTAPAWWFLAISGFRTMLYVATAVRPGYAQKALPLLALLAHFGSFGMLLPYPLRRSPLHRLYTQSALPLATFLPVRQPPFALATMWWMYATVPLFLPRGFPLNLPLADSIGACWLHLLVRLRHLPSSTTLSTVTVVRLFWVVLALVAARISAILGLNWYSTAPYVCINLPPRLKRDLRDDATRCIHAAHTSGGGAWALQAALADSLSCNLTVVVTVGLAAATPRAPLLMLTRVGQHSLLLLVTHICVCPFITVAAGRCVQYVLWVAGAGEFRELGTGLWLQVAGVGGFDIMLVRLGMCLIVSWLLVSSVQAVAFALHALTEWWAKRGRGLLPLNSVERGLHHPAPINGEVTPVNRLAQGQYARKLLLMLVIAATLTCSKLRKTEVCRPHAPSCKGWMLMPPDWGLNSLTDIGARKRRSKKAKAKSKAKAKTKAAEAWEAKPAPRQARTVARSLTFSTSSPQV